MDTTLSCAHVLSILPLLSPLREGASLSPAPPLRPKPTWPVTYSVTWGGATRGSRHSSCVLPIQTVASQSHSEGPLHSPSPARGSIRGGRPGSLSPTPPPPAASLIHCHSLPAGRGGRGGGLWSQEAEWLRVPAPPRARADRPRTRGLRRARLEIKADRSASAEITRMHSYACRRRWRRWEGSAGAGAAVEAASAAGAAVAVAGRGVAGAGCDGGGLGCGGEGGCDGNWAFGGWGGGSDGGPASGGCDGGCGGGGGDAVEAGDLGSTIEAFMYRRMTEMSLNKTA